MKTGKELILDLPNGVRRNFILQLAKEEGYKGGTKFLNEKKENLSRVLGQAFIWDSTPQGQDYWKKLYKHYQDV